MDKLLISEHISNRFREHNYKHTNLLAVHFRLLTRVCAAGHQVALRRGTNLN